MGKIAASTLQVFISIGLFFIAVGVFNTNNNLFEVWEVLAFGIAGAVFIALDFPIAPILFGFVLGPLVEDNFRRSLLLSHGNLAVFFQQPISAGFMAISILLVTARLFIWLRKFNATQFPAPQTKPKPLPELQKHSSHRAHNLAQ